MADKTEAFTYESVKFFQHAWHETKRYVEIVELNLSIHFSYENSRHTFYRLPINTRIFLCHRNFDKYFNFS